MFSELRLNIYGVTIKISSEVELIQSWLRFDFAKFISNEPPQPANVSVTIKKDPFELPKDLVESSRGQGYVCFDANQYRYVLYGSAVLAIFDRSRESVEFSGDNIELLYEKLFLFILSRAGELLERRGLHRVHGLGFSNGVAGFLYLMPMGGGKSTLGLELSLSKNFRLISDDTPLIDYKGNLLPFPLRIGGSSQEVEVQPSMKRVFLRSFREPKVVLHPDALGDIWETAPVPCRAVIIGRWTTSRTLSYKKVGKVQIAKKLLRDCVIGYGVAQVIEFFIQSTWSDLLSKIDLVLRRSRAVLSLVRNAQGYELLIPCNPQVSVSDILTSEFLEFRDS